MPVTIHVTGLALGSGEPVRTPPDGLIAAPGARAQNTLLNLSHDPTREFQRVLLCKPRSTGPTTVFATHDQDEAMDLADRMVVMSMGRIEQVGNPQDTRARPKTAFVRAFISA